MDQKLIRVLPLPNNKHNSIKSPLIGHKFCSFVPVIGLDSVVCLSEDAYNKISNLLDILSYDNFLHLQKLEESQSFDDLELAERKIGVFCSNASSPKWRDYSESLVRLSSSLLSKKLPVLDDDTLNELKFFANSISEHDKNIILNVN